MQISHSNKHLCNRRQLGFTLLEMILVMALISIAMAMVASLISRKNEGEKLRETVQKLGLTLRKLHSEAQRNQMTQTFKLYPSEHQWVAGDGVPQTFDSDIRTSVTSGRELAERNMEGVILFYPDGASSGGAIELSRQGQIWRTEVNWVSGTVTQYRETK